MKLLNKYYLKPQKGHICHASTMAFDASGTLVCAFFAGSQEGADDTAIYYGKPLNGSGKITRLNDGLQIPHWNPVLLRMPEGMWMFYKVGREISEWKTMVCISPGPDLPFVPIGELVPGDRSGGRGPVRNLPIRLKCGRILAPASLEKGKWVGFADISDDNCRSWRKSREIAIPNLRYTVGERTVNSSDIPVSEQSFYGRGVIQPAFWEDDMEVVHALLRSSEGRIFKAESKDHGETWSPAYATELPNNNSGIAVAKLPDGRLMLAYNPVAENWGARTPLQIAVKQSQEAAWENALTLESNPGEYSYPCIVINGKRAYVSYSCNREVICIAEIQL